MSRRPAGGSKLVPTASPPASLTSASGSPPLQITLRMPAVMRIRQLLILVIMPPVPTAVDESPADEMIDASILSTRGMKAADGSSAGLAV